MQSMRFLRPELRRGVLMGAPVGYVIGLLAYGGVGYLVAGATGLWVGCGLATVFAVAGLVISLRYVEVITR